MRLRPFLSLRSRTADVGAVSAEQIVDLILELHRDQTEAAQLRHTTVLDLVLQLHNDSWTAATAKHEDTVAAVERVRTDVMQDLAPLHRDQWQHVDALHDTVLQRLAQIERRLGHSVPHLAEGGGVEGGDEFATRLAGLLAYRIAGVVPEHAVEVSTDVGDLLLDARDTVILPYLREHGRWEPEVGDVLRQRVRPGSTVLDVGAHVGYFTVLLSEAVGRTGQVLAFEPDPSTFDLLTANLQRRSVANVLLANAAASNVTGTTVFSRSPYGNTGDGRITDWGASGEVLRCPSVRVDDVLPPNLRVELVKVDAQGADGLVLRGMENVLRRHAPDLVVEFWPEALEQFGTDPVALLAWLGEIGYRWDPLEQHGDELVDPSALTKMARARSTGYVDLLLTLDR